MFISIFLGTYQSASMFRFKFRVREKYIFRAHSQMAANGH